MPWINFTIIVLFSATTINQNLKFITISFLGFTLLAR
jgi:hypothetical protein